MGEERPKRASTRRLPNKYEPTDPTLKNCPTCGSDATRFVYQHLCDEDPIRDNRAIVTWEVPAYLQTQERVRCPVCKDHTVKPVLLKCGECRRTSKP
jgi:hypothetical protein